MIKVGLRDEELSDLHRRAPENADVYVMFNNIPRVDDAKRFMALAPPSPARGRGSRFAKRSGG